jgi:WD40 repeat protein
MDGTLWVWNRGAREPAKTVVAHSHNVVGVIAVSPDGRMVATLGTDRRARLWRLPDLEFIRDIDPRDADPDATTAGAMLAMAWSPDSGRLAIGTGMTKVGVWRAADGKLDVAAKVDAPQTALAFTADGRSLMVGIERTILRVDVGTGEIRQRLLGHAQAAIGMHVATDGTLISCGRDRTLRVWDPAGVALLTVPTGELSPGSLSVTADGRWAACMLDKGELAVWDLWYYKRHIAGNAEWNLNRIEPPVSAKVRERLLAEFRRASPEPASLDVPERPGMDPATIR